MAIVVSGLCASFIKSNWTRPLSGLNLLIRLVGLVQSTQPTSGLFVSAFRSQVCLQFVQTIDHS